ncbi:MAG: ATPase [Lachnospiraceae bacterium]|nr:ATPase [Lachnospiraceae bacterium]
MGNEIICSLSEMEEDSRDKQIVDLRAGAESRRVIYPGAIHICREDFSDRFAELSPEKPIYLLGRSTRSGAEAALFLREKGIESRCVEGGFQAVVLKRLQILLQDKSASEEYLKNAERSIIKRYRDKLWSGFVKAIGEYRLIEDGDRIAVCISGGKDSTLLAKLFSELYAHGKRNFEVRYLVMNPGYSRVNAGIIESNLRLLDIPAEVFDSEIFKITLKAGESPCYLCARMRRGALYSKARELGCNKIALGHHYDDVIETILMGMLYGGQIQTMMPKLHSTNFPGMELIRPMYLIREADIVRWRDGNDLHFIECACSLTEMAEGAPAGVTESKRAEVKALIASLTEKNPYAEANIFRSVENVHLDTLIAWKSKGVRHHFLDDYECKEEKKWQSGS